MKALAKWLCGKFCETVEVIVYFSSLLLYLSLTKGPDWAIFPGLFAVPLFYHTLKNCKSRALFLSYVVALLLPLFLTEYSPLLNRLGYGETAGAFFQLRYFPLLFFPLLWFYRFLRYQEEYDAAIAAKDYDKI